MKKHEFYTEIIAVLVEKSLQILWPSSSTWLSFDTKSSSVAGCHAPDNKVNGRYGQWTHSIWQYPSGRIAIHFPSFASQTFKCCLSLDVPKNLSFCCFVRFFGLSYPTKSAEDAMPPAIFKNSEIINCHCCRSLIVTCCLQLQAEWGQ